MAKLLRWLFRSALLHAIDTGALTLPSECAATLDRVLFEPEQMRLPMFPNLGCMARHLDHRKKQVGGDGSSSPL